MPSLAIAGAALFLAAVMSEKNFGTFLANIVGSFFMVAAITVEIWHLAKTAYESRQNKNE